MSPIWHLFCYTNYEHTEGYIVFVFLVFFCTVNTNLLVVVLVIEVHSVAVVTSGALIPFCNGQHK